LCPSFINYWKYVHGLIFIAHSLQVHLNCTEVVANHHLKVNPPSRIVPRLRSSVRQCSLLFFSYFNGAVIECQYRDTQGNYLMVFYPTHFIRASSWRGRGFHIRELNFALILPIWWREISWHEDENWNQFWGLWLWPTDSGNKTAQGTREGLDIF
jgi:hypothetical protein